MHCVDCKHWKRHSEKDAYLGEDRGNCLSPKYIDVSESGFNENGNDTLEYSDYEGYAASFTTGEKFGCVHFEKEGI